MIPKERRLKRKDFSEILSLGQRYNSPRLLLYVFFDKNKPNNKAKIAFSVSKKISNKATDRNKYRRRGYATIKYFISNIKDGNSLFFSFKKGFNSYNFKDIYSEVEKLLYQSNVLK